MISALVPAIAVSATCTMTTTQTVQTVSRARSLSLSLTLSLALRCQSASLETLPTELLFYIISLAATHSTFRSRASGSDSASDSEKAKEKAFASLPQSLLLDQRTLCSLALTSRSLAAVALSILYRAVYIDDVFKANLFLGSASYIASSSLPIARSVSRLALCPPTRSSYSDYCPPYSFTSELHAQRQRNYHWRTLSSCSSILGLSPDFSSPAAYLHVQPYISPVLANLRTLVVTAEVLLYHIEPQTSTSTSSSLLTPTPTELILDTYLAPPVSPSSSSPVADPALSQLSSHLTHLLISHVPETWRLPSLTLSTLGLSTRSQSSLTHLALVRRANANENNDVEFVDDIAEILASLARDESENKSEIEIENGGYEDESGEKGERRGERGRGLKQLVVVVQPDSVYKFWKARVLRDIASSSSTQTKNPTSFALLTAYLSTSHIWTRLSELAASDERLCIVPGDGGDVWARVVKHSKRIGFGAGFGGSGGNKNINVFFDFETVGEVDNGTMDESKGRDKGKGESEEEKERKEAERRIEKAGFWTWAREVDRMRREKDELKAEARFVNLGLS